MSDSRQKLALVEVARFAAPRRRLHGKPAPSFVELVLRGEVASGDIHDFVEAWHEGNDPRSISEFLGFTPAEYARWVEIPECLKTLLDRKRRRRARTGKRHPVTA